MLGNNQKFNYLIVQTQPEIAVGCVGNNKLNCLIPMHSDDLFGYREGVHLPSIHFVSISYTFLSNLKLAFCSEKSSVY